MVSLGEGFTPLVKSLNFSEKYDCELYFKLEGCNPSGSFKDRGMFLAVAKALEKKKSKIICASTGNTSASAAAYGARYNLQTIVIIPSGKIAVGKLLQAMAYGAQIVSIKGNFDQALEAVKEYDIWLKENKSKMTAPAGVGKDNYNWWMKNVQLVPYTWDELYDIIMREDDRLLTTVALERNRNRDLPELEPVSSRVEHAQRKIEALQHVMKFTEAESLFAIPEWIGFEEYLGGANALATGWNDNFVNSYVAVSYTHLTLPTNREV